MSSATRADYAEAAAAVLTTPGHDNAVYELGGDTSWTMDDLARVFGEVLGRDVALASVTPDEQRSILAGAGLDDAMTGFLVTVDTNIADSELQIDTGDLSRLIGRPTTPMADTVRTWAA